MSGYIIGAIVGVVLHVLVVIVVNIIPDSWLEPLERKLDMEE